MIKRKPSHWAVGNVASEKEREGKKPKDLKEGNKRPQGVLQIEATRVVLEGAC